MMAAPQYDRNGRLVNSGDVMSGMTGAPPSLGAGAPPAPMGSFPQPQYDSQGRLINQSAMGAGPGQDEMRRQAEMYLQWMMANGSMFPGPAGAAAASGLSGLPPFGPGSPGIQPSGPPVSPGAQPGGGSPSGGASSQPSDGDAAGDEEGDDEEGAEGGDGAPQTGNPLGNGGGIPGMPGYGGGGIPGLPGSGFPGAPGMPSGSGGIPGMPGTGPGGPIPGMPGSGSGGPIPGMPGSGSGGPIPGMPGSGRGDSIPGMPGGYGGIPGMPGGTSSPGGVPGMPQLPPAGGGGGGPVPTDTGTAVNQPREPKPQTGGPGAPQPTWQDILGPNMGIPQGSQYPGGMMGGLPGMGGGYGTAPNLPGPGSSGTGDQGKEFLKGTIDEFQRAQDSANAANNQRYQQGLDILSGMNRQQDQLLGGLSGLYGQRNTDFGTGMNNVVGAQQGILDDWLRRSGLIGQGYDALNQRVMDRTDLMGYQRANEINDAFTRQGAQADQDMINRGLSNTTIRPSVMRGIENDRERSLTGLREDVNSQLNQLDMGTTNPALQFGERAGQFASGLGGNVAGTMQQGLQGLAGLQGEGLQFGERANQYQQQTGNNVVNWIGNRNDVGPDFNTLAQLALGVGASGFGYGAMPSLPAGSTGFPTGVPSPSLPYYQSPPQQSNQPPSRAGGTAYTPGITGGPSQMRPLSNTKPYATLF